MTFKRLYLHVGFGKCGSSSIQAFLSNNPDFLCVNGDTLVYAALMQNQLIYGHELVKQAKLSPYHYKNSVSLATLKPAPKDYFASAVGDQLLTLLADKAVVLSQEDWHQEADYWQEVDIFRQNSIDVTAIFYLRPPVTWINSAWWQWGAWSGLDFEDWLLQTIDNIVYVNSIRKFSKIDWINKIEVRLLGKDLLTDFAHLLNIDLSNTQGLQTVINRSLPNGILRLYQTHPHLRPNPHASSIDFMLENFLQLDGTTDWVLTPDHITRIIKKSRNSNLALLDFLDQPSQAQLLADARYWDSSAYVGMSTRPPSGIKPTYEELEQIALAGVTAVKSLVAQQNRRNTEVNPENADFWRDLALQVESGNLRLAYELMQEAYKRRPSGPLINKKLAEYEKMLKTIK